MTVDQPLWARSLVKVIALALISLTAPQFVYAEEDDEQVVEEVVVTGSRIKRSDFTSASPITVISGQSILESGFSDVGEALRNQAVAGTAGFNQSSILSGGGSTSVDLRNLGQSRVLILINGKRVASFADALANQAVDLSFVPSAMIDRVDILRDGASAIYGSDAISGVVNVILKERFEGVSVGAQSGVTGEGDGERYSADFAIGATSDRGSVMLGMEYRYRNNINQTDRDWAFPAISSLNAGGAVNGSFFSPGGVFFDNNGGLFCTIPKAFGGDEITNDLANCPSLQARQAVTSPDQVQLLRYDYALRQDLTTQQDLYSTAAYGVYEIFDGVEGFLEAQYSKRLGISNLDGNPGSFGTPAYPQGSVVPATNPNLPAGSLGGSFFFRPSSTIGTRRSDFEVDTTRLVAGLRGDILTDGFFNNWSWELSYLYTRLDATLRTNSTWNLARFIRISDPAQCALDTLCSQVVNPSGALDVLRPGNWTQDEIRYMRQNSTALSKFQTTGWFGVVSGPVFEMPAGEVQVALGFESRTDEGLSKPDSITEAGESVANQVFTTEGSFNVDEYFVEVDVPLLSDMPGFQSLDLNLQFRHSDYSNFGEESVERFGLNWQITDDIRIRGTMSTAYRAPQVTDLFGGGVTSFDFFNNVDCLDAAVRAANPGVDANCNADGWTAGLPLVASQFAVLAGGNPNLEPETADTSTIGLVFTPGFLDGFSMSVDYWDIEVEGLITRPTSESIVNQCYNGPAGLAAPECGRFSIGVVGGAVTINGLTNQLINDDKVSTDGFDVGMAYEFDGPWATIVNMDLEGTYVRQNTFFPGQGGADDRGSIPRIKANFNANVQWEQWNFAWRVRYIHGMSDPSFSEESNLFGYEDVSSHTEHDLRVRYDWETYTAVLGVNDVFDNDPEYIFNSGNNTDTFLYDTVGRYFFLRLTADF